MGLGAVIFRIIIDLNHRLIFDKVLSKISLDFDGFNLGIILARTSRVEVGEVAPRVLTVTHKDETVHSTLDKMHEKGVGRFPVIDKENPKRIIGIIYNNDVLRIREIASQRLVE